MLPISRNCDILKQYCQFIEIVERMYNKRFPKRSFKAAIETAISQGILSDYLDRKSREVINMLCAKYDYNMDIAVKKEEAYQDGHEAGRAEKTAEAAINFYANGVSKEIIAKSLKIPIEQVQNILKNQN